MQNLLYDEIIQAIESETTIEQKIFENEKARGINAEKIMFEQVQFIKCQIPDNTFDGGEFIDVTFHGCDLSNCHLKNTYFKNCRFLNCKMDGCSFGSALFKNTRMENCSCLYCNFVSTLWENTSASDCIISNLMVSDTYTELAGAKVNIYQAAELAKLLKIQIV